MSTEAVSRHQHHSLSKLPAKACHNCRRSRLRCDKSLPGCEKCHTKGVICLGYGKLLRWTANNTVTSGSSPSGSRTSSVEAEEQGQLVRRSVGSNGSRIPCRSSKTAANHAVSSPFPLVDPVFQDLGTRGSFYISHFTHSVCQDLVSFDQLDRTNPFRYMVALLGRFDYLREIVLATSAVHLVTLRRCRGLPYRQELIDALAAKGNAMRLLRRALAHLDRSPADQPIVMIAVVFFINFDLIDSGRGQWKSHIEAAGRLIASIQNLPRHHLPSSFAQLADIVVADCITYHILGAGFGHPGDPAMSAFDSVDVVSTLQRAAAFSYGCAPPFVLNLLLKASRLAPYHVADAAALLEALGGFDTRQWVYSIPGLSPDDDREMRVSMSEAHRLATMLYIGLAVPGSPRHQQHHHHQHHQQQQQESWKKLDDAAAPLDSVLSELLGHLAAVPLEHALAKGVIWPTFMAGAQAGDAASRQWCLKRMQVIWHSTPWICPWGYIEAAIEMLQRVWRSRDSSDASGAGGVVVNWLQDMRGMRDHCLIV